RRLQNRIGLGDIDLPDEHKRPTLEGRALRPPVATAALTSQSSRVQHDPTHPGVSESRARAIGWADDPSGAPQPPSGGGLPSGASTTRMKARTSQPTEAKTTRLSAQGKGTSAKAASKSSAAKRRSSSSTPSSGQTRAM